MAATDHVAGHPIAIRVGGRRMSQSNPIRSPTKQQQTSSTSSSPEDGGAGVAEVPDYPRPRSPAKESAEDAANTEEQQQQQGGGQNRQERRRQERRREKSNRDEQQQGMALSQQNDAMFNHLRKGSQGQSPAASQKGAHGVRITQPAQKFMV